MANYFVDSTTGNDGDSGLTMDDAWATFEHAWTAGNLSADDIIFIRRIHSETASSFYTQQTGLDGTSDGPIIMMGWPRAADSSITEADWTNSSTIIDNIVGLSMDREKHLGRFVTAPDGNDYLITKITDSDTIVIDREYPGTTVTSTDGACIIKADEDWYDDMGAAYGFDDSGWTIKESDWDGDADDIPTLDFSGGNYYLNLKETWFRYQYLNIIGGTSYTIYGTGSLWLTFLGCLFSGTASEGYIRSASAIVLDRCVGDGTPGRYFRYGEYYTIRNCAFYGATSYCFDQVGGTFYLENVNFSVETSTAADLFYAPKARISGIDIKYGGSGDVLDRTYAAFYPFPHMTLRGIENFGKVFGSHWGSNSHAEIIKTDVVADSGDPYKRTGGSDSVLELICDFDDNAYGLYLDGRTSMVTPVFIHEFETTTDSKNYRYYIQTDTETVSASQLQIEAEYVSSYATSASYTYSRVQSTQDIEVRTGADDWSQYIEVTNIQPAIASKVRIKCYCSYYHASAKIYIDPKPVITPGA